MVIHPDAMRMIFQESTHDIVVDILGWNTALHDMVDNTLFSQEQTLPESSRPDSSLAIHHAPDIIGAAQRDRRSLMILSIQGKQALIRR